MSAPDTTFHCELAWLGGDLPAADVVIEVTGDRISAVKAGVAAPRDAERLRGLTLPGIANAHSHAFHRALRGRTQGGTGSFWTWRQQMYRLAAVLTPDEYHRLAGAVFSEMAQAGITCVGEFHYLHHGADGHHYEDANEMSAALVAAAADAGIRITLLDTLYLHGGIGVEANDVQRRFSDGTVAAWAIRTADAASLHSPTTRTGIAVHSVRAVDPESVAAVVEIAAARSAVVHAHVSEQPAENEECLSVYGRTPTALLADCGALSGRFTAVHATHLSDADVTLLGDHAATVCLCPTTERDLADGIGPASRLVAAGAAMSLGTDSHAVVDPFEEMRAVELGERVLSHRRGNLATPQLLCAATRDGHRSLGWDDGGTLSPGALADFVTVSLDSSRMAGTDLLHVLDSVVFVATTEDVDRVIVGGRTIVDGGRHRTVDAPTELRSTIRALHEKAGR